MDKVIWLVLNALSEEIRETKKPKPQQEMLINEKINAMYKS